MSHKLGIIVPYRNRYKQLIDFKKSIKRYFSSNEIDYELIIVEQDDGKAFNRGKLLNVGFIRAKELGCDYVVFHDVDMIPTDVDYSYSDVPLHLATDLTGIRDFKRLVFDEYFGGVTLFPSELFEHINGYSNLYWGWGFEDDDLLYRCKVHGIPLNNKEIITVGGQSAALSFNGTNAYVRGRNFFKDNSEYTIFVSFSPNDILCDIDQKTDRYSVFSIPGYDFTITFNSFSRYTVEIFKENKEIIYQMSDIKKNYKTNITVVINPNTKLIKFFQDGGFVSEESFDYLHNYVKEPYFYLGCANPNRPRDKSYFSGLINEFAVWNKELPTSDIREISENQYFGLTQNFGRYTFDYALEVYYNANLIKGYELIDLSGNRNDGFVENCEIVPMNFERVKQIQIPFRRNGSFRLMTHEENGFHIDSWKDKMTRFNQLRFHNEVNKGYSNPQEDGLSNCEYYIHGETTDKNITQMVVGI